MKQWIIRKSKFWEFGRKTKIEKLKQDSFKHKVSVLTEMADCKYFSLSADMDNVFRKLGEHLSHTENSYRYYVCYQSNFGNNILLQISNRRQFSISTTNVAMNQIPHGDNWLNEILSTVFFNDSHWDQILKIDAELTMSEIMRHSSKYIKEVNVTDSGIRTIELFGSFLLLNYTFSKEGIDIFLTSIGLSETELENILPKIKEHSIPQPLLHFFRSLSSTRLRQ